MANGRVEPTNCCLDASVVLASVVSPDTNGSTVLQKTYWNVGQWSKWPVGFWLLGSLGSGQAIPDRRDAAKLCHGDGVSVVCLWWWWLMVMVLPGPLAFKTKIVVPDASSLLPDEPEGLFHRRECILALDLAASCLVVVSSSPPFSPCTGEGRGNVGQMNPGQVMWFSCSNAPHWHQLSEHIPVRTAGMCHLGVHPPTPTWKSHGCAAQLSKQTGCV